MMNKGQMNQVLPLTMNLGDVYASYYLNVSQFKEVSMDSPYQRKHFYETDVGRTVTVLYRRDQPNIDSLKYDRNGAELHEFYLAVGIITDFLYDKGRAIVVKFYEQDNDVHLLKSTKDVFFYFDPRSHGLDVKDNTVLNKELVFFGKHAVTPHLREQANKLVNSSIFGKKNRKKKRKKGIENEGNLVGTIPIALSVASASGDSVYSYLQNKVDRNSSDGEPMGNNSTSGNRSDVEVDTNHQVGGPPKKSKVNSNKNLNNSLRNALQRVQKVQEIYLEEPNPDAKELLREYVKRELLRYSAILDIL